MPVKENLRLQSDFVFAASTSLFSEKIILEMNLAVNVHYLSSNSPICGIAIVAKIKVNSLQTSFATAKNQ